MTTNGIQTPSKAARASTRSSRSNSATTTQVDYEPSGMCGQHTVVDLMKFGFKDSSSYCWRVRDSKKEQNIDSVAKDYQGCGEIF